jgi:hypothetical protein
LTVFKKKNEKRFPLKTKPLRNPGESLEYEIDRIFEEELLPYPAMGLMALILAIYEWQIWYFKWPPQPVVYTGVAILIIGSSVYKLFSLRSQTFRHCSGV